MATRTKKKYDSQWKYSRFQGLCTIEVLELEKAYQMGPPKQPKIRERKYKIMKQRHNRETMA
jgi:hypothetical protein